MGLVGKNNGVGGEELKEGDVIGQLVCINYALRYQQPFQPQQQHYY